MVEVLRRSHGLQVDHIGLGVPNTRDGVEWLCKETGAEVFLRDPQPDSWFWSGVLPIGHRSFLEVIGPNPDWKKFHPFMAVLRELKQPTLLFWYVAVDDFDAFAQQAKTLRAPMENVESVNLDDADPDRSAYRRGYLGPGFLTERPNVIEWVRHVDIHGDATPICRLSEFDLANPNADRLNRLFEGLGIDLAVRRGPSSIKVTLETPIGPWSLENRGISFTMPTMIFKMAGLWWRSRGRKSP